MRRVLSIGSLIALGGALVWPTQVSAHAGYASSTPGKGQVLTPPPTRVEITFNSEVRSQAGTYGIDVNRDRGASATAGPALVSDDDRRTLVVPLRAGLTPGRYVVRWKNVSDADGDSAEGAFSFYVGMGPNAVDLQNDAQLEQIGAEEATPTSTEVTPGATAPGATGVTTPGAGATPTWTPIGTSASGGGDGNTGRWILLAVIGAGIVIGGGTGYFIVRRRA